MVEIPDSLVERLKERQVVLVAGLGCSELAGAAGWNELTEALVGAAGVLRRPSGGRTPDHLGADDGRDRLHARSRAAPAGRGDAGEGLPDGSGRAGRDVGLCTFPVARRRDHRVRRSVGARARGGGRRAAAADGADRGRRSRAGAVDRAGRFCTSRAASRCPRACASARATRASGWCRRRGWPGWRTWRAGARWCSSASAPPIPTWSGCRRGWRRARARRRTSCSWTCRRILTRTPRCRCGRCAPASR